MPAQTLGQALKSIGTYELIELIAEGGMGAVYKGRSLAGGDVVAIKVVPPHILSSSPVLIKRFEQEYHVAKTLDHPNIVKALDFGRDGSTPFLVMELVEGESLGQRIERSGALAEKEAIRIIAQVARGLHKAHKLGLIHRDVKPDNVLLTQAGVAKLTDLGLVKEVITDLNLTRTGRGLGTPHFMAPEQFKNAKKADARCDIYSLGATLYQMVTGVLPFQAPGPLETWMKKVKNDIAPPREMMPSLSERIDWAIRRAMNPNPALRPETCREFVEDLTGHTTRRLPSGGVETAHVWHVKYEDDRGRPQSSTGTTAGIRAQLLNGAFGTLEAVRLARRADGTFQPARKLPEFRDLIVMPSAVPKRTAAPVADRAAATTLEMSACNLAVTVDDVKSPASSRSDPPVTIHFAMPSTTSSEELAWLLGLVLAVAAGVGGYFLVPYLPSRRWW